MIDLLQNIFKPKDKKVLLEEAQAADRELNLAAEIARRCLTSEDFKSYRESYLKAEDKMVEAMIIYTQGFVQGNKGDVTNYAFTMMRFITRLQEIRSLLRDVETTAERLPKE